MVSEAIKVVDSIRMEHITKRFPGVLALDDVSFTLKAGEIHALLGENGAGKSTLMKVLSGMYKANSGDIFIGNKPVDIQQPQDALEQGIGMVYQQFTLAPELTVLENILLGSKLPFFFSPKSMVGKVNSIIEQYGLHVDLNAKAWQLSVGEQQRVEIIKCFYHEAKVLILDEPTSVLTPPETKELFAMMRRVKETGRSVIFISHKLNEVLEVANRITVFRKGRLVATADREEATVCSLSRLMVGRDVDLQRQDYPVNAGEKVLTIRSACAHNDKDLPALCDVSLDIHAGEIVGIAAVSGNGQAELAEAISGLRKLTSGEITLNTGEKLSEMKVRDIICAGISHISEKRLDRSLVPQFSIAQNLIIKDYRNPKFKKGAILDMQAIEAHANSLICAYAIAAPLASTKVKVLSGGNLQKVVLARELSRAPRVILAVNPTYGLDIGAIEFVQKRLLEERERGAAILLISEELDEVLRLSDRIAVMTRGKIVQMLERDSFDREWIGTLMTGGNAQC